MGKMNRHNEQAMNKMNVRYTLVMAYINDQTDEQWETLVAAVLYRRQAQDAIDLDNQKAGKVNLDVDAPEQVPALLHRAAQLYYDSEGELQSAWQDAKAGRVWREFAKILERAAWQCTRAIRNYV